MICLICRLCFVAPAAQMGLCPMPRKGAPRPLDPSPAHGRGTPCPPALCLSAGFALFTKNAYLQCQKIIIEKVLTNQKICDIIDPMCNYCSLVFIKDSLEPDFTALLAVENLKTALFRKIEKIAYLKIFGRNLVDSRRLKSWQKLGRKPKHDL